MDVFPSVGLNILSFFCHCQQQFLVGDPLYHAFTCLNKWPYILILEWKICWWVITTLNILCGRWLSLGTEPWFRLNPCDLKFILSTLLVAIGILENVWNLNIICSVRSQRQENYLRQSTRFHLFHFSSIFSCTSWSLNSKVTCTWCLEKLCTDLLKLLYIQNLYLHDKCFWSMSNHNFF